MERGNEVWSYYSFPHFLLMQRNRAKRYFFSMINNTIRPQTWAACRLVTSSRFVRREDKIAIARTGNKQTKQRKTKFREISP